MATENENTSGFISLADFAEMVTDEISVLTSRLPAAGMFDVLVEEVKVSMTEPKEEGQAPLFRVGFVHKILAAKPLDKEMDPESLVGKTVRETYTIWPNDFAAAVGLLKGRYKSVDVDYSGRLGGVEGQEPGWLDNIVGKQMRLRVRHATIKEQDRAFYDWLKAEDANAESAAA